MYVYSLFICLYLILFLYIYVMSAAWKYNRKTATECCMFTFRNGIYEIFNFRVKHNGFISSFKRMYPAMFEEMQILCFLLDIFRIFEIECVIGVDKKKRTNQEWEGNRWGMSRVEEGK